MMSLLDGVAFFDGQHHLLIFGRVADTVNGGHGGDDNHVIARHQVFGGGKAHLLDVFVDRAVFFSMNKSRLGT